MRKAGGVIALLVVTNIVSGYAIEVLRRQAIRSRTHETAEYLEPWEESAFERTLLKMYILVSWWKIVVTQRRRGASWHQIATDLLQTLVDPIDPNKLHQLRAYAGL